MHKNYKAFYDHIGINHPYRSILALNGDLPNKAFFTANIAIIAADGAVNALGKMGLKPNVVVGDLDSASPHLLHDIEVIYRPDQDSCDFQKLLDYSYIENLMPSIIVGVSGGAIDHILQNINLFATTDSVFYADPIVSYNLTEGDSKSLKLPLNTKISLIGMGACVSSTGLKWELKGFQMDFPGANSSFNRSVSQEVTITVHQGICLIMIYLENILDSGTR